MALGQRKHELAPITRRWGIAGRVKLPTPIAEEFRSACDAAGVAYKRAFAAMVEGAADTSALATRIEAGIVKASKPANDPAVHGIVEMRMHFPEPVRDALLIAGSSLQPGMDLTTAASAVIAGFAGKLEKTIAKFAKQKGDS